MTIAKAIAQTNALKPHEYTDDVLIGWLADVEQLILREIIMWHRPRWWPCCRPKPPAENPLNQEIPPVIEDGDEDTGDDGAADDGTTEGGDTGENVPEEEKPEDERPKWPPERYTAATPSDTVLIVPDPYSELYLHYLAAQIDYSNAEITRHANSVAMFEAALSQFANMFNRTHMPAQRAYVRI